MQVSIIIVNYNTKDLLYKCIKSIYDKTMFVDYEVIISDNGSVDGSVEMLKNTFPNVKVIENNANLGFGKANNIGIKEAKGKYLFLLNSDTYFLDNCIKIFHDFMENNENDNIACVGGDLVDEEGFKQPSYGNFPSIFDAFSQLGFYKFYQSYYNKNVAVGIKNEGTEIKVVDYICGADMFLRKSIMDRVGYFDEDFFLYFEETEMSFRINKNGYKSVLLPQTKIVHLEGGTQKKQNESLFKVMQMTKSRNLYFQKCHGFLAALIVKYIFLFHSIILLISKRDKKYIKYIKINCNA